MTFRRTLSLLSFTAAVAAPAHLRAQDRAAVALEAKTRAPSCDEQLSDRITVVGGTDRPRLDSAARSISYWLRAAGDPRDRSTQLGVRVNHERAVEVVDGPVPADSAFQAAARQAVLGAIAEHAFDGLAPAAGDPASYTVYFGRTAEGRPAKPVSRRVCYAVERSDNRKMAFPPELKPALGNQQASGSASTRTMTQGTVRARFRVDSAGAVVPGTIVVIRATDEAFARELQRSLPGMRFYPATIDGRPLAQVVEQEFAFELNY